MREWRISMFRAGSFAAGAVDYPWAGCRGVYALPVGPGAGRCVGLATAGMNFNFRHGDRSHTRKEGAGSRLGLAIARQLVQAHGGRIGVESTPGEGTRFLIDL
ncbi:MAG: hypothetical protein IH586_05780 [Anaerolineaceae bacterium]|nr:hypothetical protein [Anaerolineaceae bacterium]